MFIDIRLALNGLESIDSMMQLVIM